MNSVDKKILELIDTLIANGVIRFRVDFCESVGLLPQNLIKITKNESHFTLKHVYRAIKKYKVDANWIFGTGKNIFLKEYTNSYTNKN